MIDLLGAQHRTLSTSLQELETLDPERAGLRIALGIYKHILRDGITILESIIQYLARS